MSSRRDFLRGFTALATGLVLAPATALADIVRLGRPQEWLAASWTSGSMYEYKPGMIIRAWDWPRDQFICTHAYPSSSYTSAYAPAVGDPRLPESLGMGEEDWDSGED